jgi:Dolichyl-phosphate-mannose-protein mannosyltransferase
MPVKMPTRKRLEVLLVGGCFALFAWRELGAMRADGVTLDEPQHLAYGERGLLHGTFARQEDLLNSKMPVTVLNALPVVIAERLAKGGGPLDAVRRLALARLPTLLLGVVLGWLVLQWARELFGARGGALALVLYTFCPNVLAHAHLVTTDVATALGMFGATYAFWRYRRQPSPGRLAVTAAAFGAAQLTKVTALFLIPCWLIIVAIEALLGKRRDGAAAGRRPERTGAALLTVLALGAGALAAINLGFAGERTLTPLAAYEPASGLLQAVARLPLVRDLPLPLPLPYVQGIDMVVRDARVGSPSYLHGRISHHGFREYFLVAMAIKVPLGTLALLALAACLAASGRVRAADAEAYLLVPVVFLALYLSFFFELQIGLRYLLPAFPFLFVFAARAAAWQPLASPRGAAVGLLAAWTAVSSLAFHPRYIPYFNELIGRPSRGYRWLADSNLDWGQDSDFMHRVYAPQSPEPVWFDPTGPIAGRVAMGLTSLVMQPQYAWLRQHFQPAEVVHGSWALFDVREKDIARCCAGLPRAWPLPAAELAGDLAAEGVPIGGGDGIVVRLLARLNDRMLGANTGWDAVHTSAAAAPVKAWFGIAWEAPREIGRVVAYPSLWSRGAETRSFLATDYVWQWWDGREWVELPGTRVQGNRLLRIEHRFPPVRTTAIRLLIERELNAQGTETQPAIYRAACLELAAFAR